MNTTWINELTAVTNFVNSKLDSLAESSSDDGGKMHISELSSEAAELAPSFEGTLLKNLISDYINSCEGFKVVRGQHGGAMRDNDANRPKSEKRAEEVAARKADRAEAKAQKEAEKEAKRQERAREKAQKAAERAAQAEAARLAAEAEKARLEAETEVSDTDETSEVAV